MSPNFLLEKLLAGGLEKLNCDPGFLDISELSELPKSKDGCCVCLLLQYLRLGLPRG
jgi:hypothetical protein